MNLCFPDVAAVKSLDELRCYSIVQGMDWTDNIILRENGFRVLELDGYHRKVFQLTNSAIKTAPKGYEKYLIDAKTLKH